MPVIIDKIKGVLMHRHEGGTGDNYEYWRLESGVEQRVKFGYLYKHAVTTDVRNIAADGWRVTTSDLGETVHSGDFAGLLKFLDPAYVSNWSYLSGVKIKQEGPGYWPILENVSIGTNISGFNARGSGWINENGVFNPGDSAMYWAATKWEEIISEEQRGVANLVYSGVFQTGLYGIGTPSVHRKAGCSIRLVREVTPLSNGQIGTYTGNNGRIYKTICIDKTEFLAENLAETEFRNGDPLTKITDAITWAASETEAYCSLNFNEGNVFHMEPVEQRIYSHDLLKLIAGENIQISLTDKTVTISGIGKAKYYSGLISQAGTEAPTISLLQDDLTTVVLARTAAGTYTMTKAGAFTAGKTIPNTQEDYIDSLGNLYQMIWTSADVMTLKTYAAVNTSVLADGVLDNQYISIKIFV